MGEEKTLPAMQKLLSGAYGGAVSASALEKELSLGFELDNRRRVEDEMKKRAIHTAPSYDQFRLLVAASSQKPVTAADYAKRAAAAAGAAVGGDPSRAVGLGLSLGGDAAAGGGGCDAAAPSRLLSAGAAGGAASTSPAPSFGAPPASPAEFERTWRRLPAERRLAFLIWLGPQRLGHAFRMDIDATALGPLLLVFGSDACEEGALGSNLALGLVSSAPAASLGLAVDLLAPPERDAAARVVARAEAAGLDGAPLLRRCLL
jgi:hypothetical protein